jgi:hypothetical protein
MSPDVLKDIITYCDILSTEYRRLRAQCANVDGQAEASWYDGASAGLEIARAHVLRLHKELENANSTEG